MCGLSPNLKQRDVHFRNHFHVQQKLVLEFLPKVGGDLQVSLLHMCLEQVLRDEM